jgi:hypothetical protein
MKPFDPNAAFALAVRLARPRRTGGAAIAQVGQELSAELQSAGWQVQAEPFAFVDTQTPWLRLVILAAQLLVVLTLVFSLTDSPLRLVTVLLLLALMILFTPLDRAMQVASLVEGESPPSPLARLCRRLCRRLGRRYDAANYLAHLPANPETNNLPLLLLLAHYDSKSQRLPLALRIALFVLSIIGAVLFSILVLLSPWLPSSAAPAVQTALLALGGLTLLFTIPLWFLDPGDASPGAIDNASGIGVLVELGRCLAADPDLRQRLVPILLLTSAEELNTMGAVAYVRRHDAELRAWDRSGGLFVLNFDGVGVDGDLRWVGCRPPHPVSASELCAGCTQPQAVPPHPCLHELASQACAGQGISLKGFNLPGAAYDHQPFASLGLDAGALVAVGRASLRVHTPADDASQLDPRGFERAGAVAWD